MSKNNLIKHHFSMANIMIDIKQFENFLPNIIQPIITNTKLIYKRKLKNKKIIEFENEVFFNNLEKKLIMKNGEKFEGIINKKQKEIFLKKGIYLWPSNIKYIGTFNSNNTFDGLGKIKYNDKFEFESQFSNGFPIKNGKLKKKIKDRTHIYIQSNFKYNKKSKKIIFNEQTIIQIIENKEKIYYLLGIFENGKLIGDIFINKKIDYNRYTEIRGYFKNGKIDSLLKIKDVKPGNTYLFMGDYKYGYKDGFFKIKDKLNNITLNEEIHDILNSINIIKKILKRENREIMKILKDAYKEKLLEIKYNLFNQKIQKIIKSYLKEYFQTIKYLSNQYKFLHLFNKKYKTSFNLDTEIIHLNHIKLGIDGLILLCKINFFNLSDISLSEGDINDFSNLKNAKFPKIENLSLGKNNISSIQFINTLPFPKLKNIMLGVNLIKDLSPLASYKSINLKALFLLDNKISDIKPLINMGTPNLEELYLGSDIVDIIPLKNCSFPKLKQLSLKNNKIQNISGIIDFNFPNLELLILSYNYIDKISSLLKAKFPKLNEISLNNNLISNLAILSKFPMSFQNLKKLDISKNKFSTISDDFNILISSLKKKIKNINY